MGQKTYMPEVGPGEKRWVLFDADGRNLGRLATRVASVLRGKHKPEFTPHLDCGDGVIVINAAEVNLTGKKSELGTDIYHSGHIGGLKVKNLGELLEENPARVVRRAVRGMLPKNRLRDRMMKHLRIYPGSEHSHSAQQPVEYDWENETVHTD